MTSLLTEAEAASALRYSTDELVTDLVTAAAGKRQVQERANFRYLLQTGAVLEHQCAARLLPGVAALKLEGFRQHWKAETLRHEATSAVLLVPLARTLWQRCLGRQAGLQLHVRLVSPAGAHVRQTQVLARIEAVGLGQELGSRLLHEVGPVLIESLRAFLQASPEQRRQERLLCELPLRVRPIFTSGRPLEPVACRGKDISRKGIGLFVPYEPRAAQMCVLLATSPRLGEVAVPARIVRAQAGPRGCFEVGAAFLEDPLAAMTR
jgi:hypothetical protein